MLGNGKKLWNMQVTMIPTGLLKGLDVVGGRMETIQNDSIIENGQNTEKSPGDLWRLAVIQIPVKNHRLTLM